MNKFFYFGLFVSILITVLWLRYGRSTFWPIRWRRRWTDPPKGHAPTPTKAQPWANTLAAISRQSLASKSIQPLAVTLDRPPKSQCANANQGPGLGQHVGDDIGPTAKKAMRQPQPRPNLGPIRWRCCCANR